MASKKHSNSEFNNPEEFNFIIKDGMIMYPKLLSKTNSSDKLRFWQIYGILQSKKDKINITKKIIDIDEFNKLKEKNLKMYIHTEYGLIDGKLTKTEPTIIETGKNIGKKNETTVLTQSLINMRTLYLKKIKTGYKLKLDSTEKKLVFPMAIHRYDKFSDKINYPCYVQNKLDGHRCTISYDFKNDKLIVLSRRLHEINGFDFLKDEVKKVLEENHDLILDGELYNHNMDLQQISGIVRGSNIKDKQKLEYHIFDFIDLKHKLTFQERITILSTKFNEHQNLIYLILVNTKIINSEEEGNKIYENAIKNDYEGIVYKNMNALYQYSTIKESRSYEILKRKKHFDEEYKIFDYIDGKGKDRGAIVFIMTTTEGKLFNVVPNMTLKKRKEMYKLSLTDFDNLYKGKWATIAFDEYSSDGTPLRARFIIIRDYE
jgi:ATP-dependent DNA ligase